MKNTINKDGQYTSVYIDGPVGAGKSTLMNILTGYGYRAFPEKIDNPFLERYYYDKERWSFDTQVSFAVSRVNHIKSTFEHPKVVLDRFVLCDYIFAEMLTDTGYMKDFQFQLYQELIKNMLDNLPSPSLMVYLQISTEEAMNRINLRGREYEVVEKKDYWDELNKRYQKFFNNYDHSPLLVIDVTNLDFENNQEDRKQVLDLINDKLISLGHESIYQPI